MKFVESVDFKQATTRVKASKAMAPDLRNMFEFVSAASRGDAFVYGSGAKGLRRSTRDYAWRLHECGYVHLVQRRDANGVLNYVMIRSRKPAAEDFLRQFGPIVPADHADA